MSNNQPDIIEELATQIIRLMAEGKSPDDAIRIAEEGCRRFFGGSETYVKKNRTDRHVGKRDRAILQLYARGEHIEHLAFRFKLTTRQIRRIVRKE